ncbi:MAG: hypothetical protein AAGA99_08195 [Actinomycetota bacterium]
MRLADIDTDVETAATTIAELRRRRHDLERAEVQIHTLLGAVCTRIELIETVQAARLDHVSACERLEILLAALPELDTPTGIDHELLDEVDLDGGLRLSHVAHAEPHVLEDEIDRLLWHQRRLSDTCDCVMSTINEICVEIRHRYRTTT